MRRWKVWTGYGSWTAVDIQHMHHMSSVSLFCIQLTFVSYFGTKGCKESASFVLPVEMSSGVSCDASSVSCDANSVSCDASSVSCDANSVSCDASGVSCLMSLDMGI